MNKKEFNFSEIIGIIVILVVVIFAFLLYVFNIDLNKKREEKYENKKIEFIKAATRWKDDNEEELSYYNEYYLTLNELEQKKYISKEDMKDPRNKEVLDGCIVINFVKEKYEIQYIEESCKENQLIKTPMIEKIKLSEKITLDSDKNIRYVGSNPNNYVFFNNELWRIVGVFHDQAKIVRDEYYSERMAWNSDNINNWNESTLKKELNETFYDNIDEHEKEYILEYTWNIEGYADSEKTREEFYQLENMDSTIENNPKSWTGKIGLLYPSDYGYATSHDNCEMAMNHWIEECSQNNWLYREEYDEWTITSNNKNNHNVFAYSKGVLMSLSSENKNVSVRPALYLKEDVKITRGKGTEENPYYLSI